MKMPVVLRLMGLLFLTLISLLFANPFENQDTVRVLAVRVEFQPDNASTTTGDGTFDLGASSDPYQIDPPPHNRSYFKDHLLFLKNYFRKVSRGELILAGEVFPLAQNSAYQLDHPMAFYNPNTTPGEINQGLAGLFRDAIQKADEDPALDFSQYDVFIVFHAGVGRDINIGLDETPQDISSLFITQDFLRTNLGIDGIEVDGGAKLVTEGSLLPETESQEGLQLGLNGMVVSNFGSQLGWLDLFSPDTRRSGVGRFSLMDAGLFNGDGLLPALPDAWTRINAGWETPITIYQSQDDELEVHAALSGDEQRLYKFLINENEYYLAENRFTGEKTPESYQLLLYENRNEFPTMREVLSIYFPDEAVFGDSTGVLIDIDNPDRGLPGGLAIARNDTTLPGGTVLAAGDTIWYSTGVLIWHIDENVIAQNRAENHINADPNHRGVDLEEADGSQDIGEEFQIISGGAGSEIGTVLDSWYADNPAPVFIQNPKNEFSVNSIPNSRSYYNRADSHIKLFDFSRLDSVMTFRAALNFFQVNFPRKIDPAAYGQVTSLKVADLDNSASEELVFTTDQNKVLVMNKDGQSGWGSDSLQILSFPGNSTLVNPPAIFGMPDGSQAIVLLANEGDGAIVYGFRFNKPSQSVDSLFSFRLNEHITTFPIVEGDPPVIYWGSEAGKVYQVDFEQGSAVLSEFTSIPEAVRYLQFVNSSEAVIVSEAGKVFRNGGQFSEVSAAIFQPAGEMAVSVSKEGFFYDFSGEQSGSPEDGIHRFDAAPIALRLPGVAGGELQDVYVSTGNNLIRVFNYNFTLRTNFPQKIYNPEQPTDLFVSPVAGNFLSQSGADAAAIIAIDPAGMITGYDLQGRLLPDFPLATGDSVKVSPALLDIDGDQDLELACITAGGSVYVWDFSSRIDAGSRPLWAQQYGTPQNNNRQLLAGSIPAVSSDNLLPPEAVYNWPNPNIDNYTFIRYRLNEDAEVSIRIFDLAGDLVKVLEGTGNALTDNEVRWDLQGVQSGVYIGRVEARSSTRSEVQIIKIAVVK